VDISTAVSDFRRAALAKGDFATPPTVDHALYEEMARAWRLLDEAGPAGRAAFRALLLDDSLAVRAWVATQLLALGDKDCADVLRALADSNDPLSFASSVTLREWTAGRLKPPFGGLTFVGADRER
jgi:hypothetical protein